MTAWVSLKLNNDLMPNNNKSFFEINKNLHSHNTRNKTSTRALKHKTALFNKSIFNVSIREWNKVPLAIKQSTFLKVFTSNLTRDILNKY